MSELDEFYVHTISVQTLTGSGGMGNTYATAVALLCMVEEKLVRSPDGSAVNSETRIYAPKEAAAILTEGSLATLPSGATVTIDTTAVHDYGALDLPDHLEATVI